MTENPSDNSTGKFLGRSYSWSRAAIELKDIQPLHGGINLLLPQWTAAQALVTHVAPGGKQTKYRIALQIGEKDQLCQLFIEQDFLTIKPENRPGVPDEARPSITLTNPAKDSHTVAKWAGVKDARFDAIYAALAEIGQRIEGKRPIPERLRPYQKTLVIIGLLLLLLGLLLLANQAAAAVAASWWPSHPGRLAVATALLIGGIFPALLALYWRERKLPRFSQTISNPVFLLLSNVFLLTGLLTLPSFGWRMGMLLWGETAVAQIQTLTTTASYDDDAGWQDRHQLTYLFHIEDQSFTRKQYVTYEYFTTLTEGGKIDVTYYSWLPRFSMPSHNLASDDYAIILLSVIFAFYLLILSAGLAGQPLTTFIDDRF